jgi:hypothetical protein
METSSSLPTLKQWFSTGKQTNKYGVFLVFPMVFGSGRSKSIWLWLTSYSLMMPAYTHWQPPSLSWSDSPPTDTWKQLHTWSLDLWRIYTLRWLGVVAVRNIIFTIPNVGPVCQNGAQRSRYRCGMASRAYASAKNYGGTHTPSGWSSDDCQWRADGSWYQWRSGTSFHNPLPKLKLVFVLINFIDKRSSWRERHRSSSTHTRSLWSYCASW